MLLLACPCCPSWWGPSVAGALAGGLYFLRKAWALARRPSRKTAMGSFFASLVQLSLVLSAASVDALLR